MSQLIHNLADHKPSSRTNEKQHMLATTETAALVRRNWETVKTQVADACQRYGREPGDVTVIGVSKYVDATFCQQLVEAGCNVLGENRPQSLWEKCGWFAEQHLPQPQWHLIGHWQRNKVRRTLPLIACLHALDSLRLAKEVSREATALGRELPVLVEVNVTQDTNKTGLPHAEVDAFMETVTQLPGLSLKGLMAMASLDGDREAARREFAMVRELRDRLATRFPELTLSELSMGMSGDYAEAIAEGATLIRIGSSLWRGIIDQA